MTRGASPSGAVITLARTEDWAEVRKVRVRALTDAPFAFESRWDEEKDLPEAFWRARLERDNAATFLAVREHKAVGLVTGLVDAENPERVDLVSMWVAPEVRRQGLGRELIASVVRWAHEQGASFIELWVTETNHLARTLYESCGFTYTGKRKPGSDINPLSEVAMRMRLRNGP
jgi:GNAT superfamily N-acetyltransferase